MAGQIRWADTRFAWYGPYRYELRILYFDCYSGISGDMLIGSLMGAGCDFKKWRALMETLPLAGWSASIKK